ncbi:MAG: 4Fe-4S binding protein [Sphaerochaetaceae bacterium]|nr:4Fe-4S binding protein [Sphaerochaetaceae bacterium]
MNKKKNGRKLIRVISFTLSVFLIIDQKMIVVLALYLISVALTPIFGRFYGSYLCVMDCALNTKISQKKRVETISDRLTFYLPFLSLAVSAALMILFKKTFHRQLPILLILLVLSFVYGLAGQATHWHNYICPFSPLLRTASHSPVYSYRVDEKKCLSCTLCAGVCSVNAVVIDEKSRKAAIKTSLCHQCGECASACPADAIVYGK